MSGRVKVRWEVDPITGCWNWLLCIHRTGYGMDGGRVAHKVVYEKLVGPVPEGKQLDHLCRNRKCVNPDHLEIVTNAINQQRGSHTKLTLEQVKEMRQRFQSGIPYRSMAKDYGVAENTIWRTVSGQSWKETYNSNF